MAIGTATSTFVNSPATMSWQDFAGVAFLIFLVAMYWSRFINDIA